MNENNHFNEIALRNELISKFGEFGAHVDLYDRILKKAASAQPYTYEHAFNYEFQASGILGYVLFRISPALFHYRVRARYNRYISFLHACNQQ